MSRPEWPEEFILTIVEVLFIRGEKMAEFANLFEKSKLLIDNARGTIGVLVNPVTVYTSFLLGKYMVEEEQQGSNRAKYGAKFIWYIVTAMRQLSNCRLDN